MNLDIKGDVLDVVNCRAAFHLSLAKIGIRNARRDKKELQKQDLSPEASTAFRKSIADGVSRFRANRPLWKKYRRASRWVEVAA